MNLQFPQLKPTKGGFNTMLNRKCVRNFILGVRKARKS